MCEGIQLGDGPALAYSAEVVPDLAICVKPLFMCPNYQKVDSVNFFVRVVTSEGRNRIVRRMLAAVGLPVLALHRERIGGVPLDPTSVPGSIRELTNTEILTLR